MSGSMRPAYGQAVVCDSRELLIWASYEDVLARMDGEQSSREMFASQKLQLLEYKPRKKDESQKFEEGVTKGAIDIVGTSCEFGTMYYLMSVRASEKETVIDVQLTQPVGMLRHQSYRFLVAPRGKDQTTIRITHELDVVLMQRRLKAVNQIIKKVTYKKACEEIHELTEQMSRCVASIASRPLPQTQADATSGADTEDADDPEKMEEPDEESVASNASVEADTKPANTIQADTIQANTDQADKITAPGEPSPSDQSKSLPPSESSNNSVSNETASTATIEGASQPPTSDASMKVESTTPESSQESAAGIESTVAPPVASPVAPTFKAKQDTESAPPSDSQALLPAKENHEPPQKTAAKEEKPKAPLLRVTIEGVTTASGSIRIALFDKNDQYKAFDARNEEASQGDAFRKVAVKVKRAGKVVYEFKDVPPGSYAIAAFHDKDGNQKLNASVIGLPSEPYGFSRDARGTFGAPKFEDAVIQFDQSNSNFLFKIK